MHGRLAESARSAISAQLDGLYARTDSPSIPPERLLKIQLLNALYSVRSDRQFCEQLDLDLESGGLDQSNFSCLRERLVDTDIPTLLKTRWLAWTAKRGCSPSITSPRTAH